MPLKILILPLLTTQSLIKLSEIETNIGTTFGFVFSLVSAMHLCYNITSVFVICTLIRIIAVHLR